jgi:hypothetical protein
LDFQFRIFDWRCAAALLLTSPQFANGQEPLDGREGRELLLDRFRPVAKLKVEQHHLTRARFPVVDVHVHPRIRLRHSSEELDEFVRVMDRQNVAVCVSLDGGMGEAFDEHAKYFPYAETPFPPQGFWRIYGVTLPDEVLRKVYSENAARIIPGVKERLADSR